MGDIVLGQNVSRQEVNRGKACKWTPVTVSTDKKPYQSRRDLQTAPHAPKGGWGSQVYTQPGGEPAGRTSHCLGHLRARTGLETKF